MCNRKYYGGNGFIRDTRMRTHGIGYRDRKGSFLTTLPMIYLSGLLQEITMDYLCECGCICLGMRKFKRTCENVREFKLMFLYINSQLTYMCTLLNKHKMLKYEDL
jgi:hypothetical protein